jgi:Lsr2
MCQPIGRVALEDDLNGGPAKETVRFGFESAEFEIDVSAKKAHVFRQQLQPCVEHTAQARPLAGVPGYPDSRRAAARQRGQGVGRSARHRQGGRAGLGWRSRGGFLPRRRRPTRRTGSRAGLPASGGLASLE